jgi:hypothetical protein
MNDLGYAKEYGHVILSAVLIAYGFLCSFLFRDYETPEE